MFVRKDLDWDRYARISNVFINMTTLTLKSGWHGAVRFTKSAILNKTYSVNYEVPFNAYEIYGRV